MKNKTKVHTRIRIFWVAFFSGESLEMYLELNIFDLLSVGVEIKHHGTTGPDQEPHTHHVNEGMNESIE